MGNTRIYYFDRINGIYKMLKIKVVIFKKFEATSGIPIFEAVSKYVIPAKSHDLP